MTAKYLITELKPAGRAHWGQFAVLLRRPALAKEAVVYMFILGVILLAAMPTKARAQASLTESQFLKMAENSSLTPGCLPLRIGGHHLRPGDSNVDREILITLFALEKAGAVHLVNDLSKNQLTPEEFKKAHDNALGIIVDVRLQDNIDRDSVDARQGGPCLILPKMTIERVAKIEMVKGGGALKWDGAIVYYVVSRAPGSKLFQAYRDALAPDRRFANRVKARSLYRHDPFSSSWRHLTTDHANVEELDFRTSRVIEFLRRE
jgi:hypothetical protein